MIDGDNAEILVRNQGKTIPEHQLNNLFEKFYRLDEARSSETGGAGLGLAIAKEIIELHDGTIKAKSQNEYTTFIIRLPRKKHIVPVISTAKQDMYWIHLELKIQNMLVM